MAAAAVAVAHRRGVDVPGDLSICGFDDTPFATTIWPALTTIHQPIADMSRAALDQLVAEARDRRSGKPSPHRRVLLDYSLVRRHSDAPPRRRRPEVVAGKTEGAHVRAGGTTSDRKGVVSGTGEEVRVEYGGAR